MGNVLALVARVAVPVQLAQGAQAQPCENQRHAVRPCQRWRVQAQVTGSSSPALLCGAECCTGNVRCSRLHPHTYGISLVDKLQRKYEAIEERPVRVCGLCRQDLALDVINAWIIGTENTSAREMLVLAVMAGWSRPQKGQRTGRLKGDGKVAAAIVQPGIVLVQDKH